MNVGNPYLKQTWPSEVIDCVFECSEGFFKVSILPKEVREVKQHNWSQASVIFATLIGKLCGLEISDGNLQIDI